MTATTSQTIRLDCGALYDGDQLDYGVFEILHRKYQKQINWRIGPLVPYCTRAGGSITDRYGVTWSVSSSGVIEKDRMLDRKTRDVGLLLLLGDMMYHQRHADWYRYADDSWQGPLPQSPWLDPGVDVPHLAPGTAYELTARATSSTNRGALCEPIVFTTSGHRRVRKPHSMLVDPTADYVVDIA